MQLDISMAGMVIAGISVVSSGLQQIFVRTMQQKHKLTAHELLSNTAPAQVLLLGAAACLPPHALFAASSRSGVVVVKRGWGWVVLEASRWARRRHPG